MAEANAAAEVEERLQAWQKKKEGLKCASNDVPHTSSIYDEKQMSENTIKRYDDSYDGKKTHKNKIPYAMTTKTTKT